MELCSNQRFGPVSGRTVSQPSSGDESGPSPASRHSRTRFLVGVCAVQFALLIALTWWSWDRKQTWPPRAQRPAAFSSTANREPYFAGKPGPWGEIEYIRVNLEIPEEFVDGEEQGLGATKWFFAGMTREQLLEFFNASPLTEAQRTELREVNRWAQEADGILIQPSSELIFGLAPEARAVIYAQLARSARNDFQASPFVYRTGGFADWFGQSGLSEATIALVQRVVYQRGTALCVSDLPALCARVTDRAERRRLIKTLSRSAALLMKLRVEPGSDTEALTEYWSQGWHVKDIGPLLQSLTRVTNGMTIDVVHLLPPFARRRVNSYPTPLAPGQRPPDCYWTAFNFFNDTPDDRYFDDNLWRQALQQDYQLTEQPTLGDLVFLTRPDGVPIHCAVFIADDVVFTKNGANLRQPWKLMKMEDMLARYPEDYPLRVAFFHSAKRNQ